VVWLQLGEAFRLPLARLSWDSNGYFDTRTPQCKSLLADAARGKDEEWLTGLASGHTDRGNYAGAKPVGLAEGSCFMAQTGGGIRWVKADAGKYLSGLCEYGRGTSVAGWKSSKRLLDCSVDE